jgi:hypothetical protein
LNQGERRPIMGVRALPVARPIRAIAAKATGKLGEAPRRSIDPPAPRALMPIIARLPYRGASVPATRELNILTTAATVIKTPT